MLGNSLLLFLSFNFIFHELFAYPFPTSMYSKEILIQNQSQHHTACLFAFSAVLELVLALRFTISIHVSSGTSPPGPFKTPVPS